MKIQYCPDTDTLHIELSPAEIHETRGLDEDTPLDLDADGRLCAITIEHASDRTEIPAFSYAEITDAHEPTRYNSRIPIRNTEAIPWI